MKRIGIYFFCVVALGCLTSSILYRKSERANEIRLEKTAQDDVSVEENRIPSEEEIIEVSDNGVVVERFLVIEEDGYLVIYDRQNRKRYDETTIRVFDLPERLQEQVREGLYFLDEEELYAFLENYSS